MILSIIKPSFWYFFEELIEYFDALELVFYCVKRKDGHGGDKCADWDFKVLQNLLYDFIWLVGDLKKHTLEMPGDTYSNSFVVVENSL